MLKRLLLVLLLGCPTLPGTQNNPPLDTVATRIKGLLLEKKYDDALTLLLPAARSAQKAKDWENYCSFIMDIGKVYRDKRDFAGSVNQLEEAIEIMTQAQADPVLTARVWSSKAVSLRRLEQYGAALNAYQTAISISEKAGCQGDGPAYSYKNAAQIYQRYSYHQQASDYLQAALRNDTAHTRTAEIYSLLASNCLFTDSLPSAEAYCRLGQAEKKKSPAIQAELDKIEAELALRQGDLATAKFRIQAALDFYLVDSSDTDNLIRSLSLLSDIAARRQQPRIAMDYYRQAEAIGQQYYDFKSREMAKLYIEWGRFLEKQRQPDRALACYQQALIQAFPKFNSLKITDNPSLDEAWLESQAMEAALAKGRLLATSPASFSWGNRVEIGMNAAYCFDLAFAVAARLRRTYGNDADKLALAANLRAALNTAVLNLREMYAADHNEAHTYHLFELLEQTRATALSDALRQQRALALTGIPDTLLAREESLRREAAALENDLKKTELARDSAGIAHLQPISFKADMAYSQLLLRIINQYPQFSQYTQADQAAEIKAIAQALPDTTALLSWHDAGDRYLCVYLQRGNLSLHEILRDTLFDQVLARFIGLLSDKTEQERDAAAFFRDAQFLGQKLLPSSVLSVAKSLIIIPDGLLCRLPFEVLLTQAHPGGGFGNAPYLLRSHTVQYAWSATLLTQSAWMASSANGLLQLAPFATSTRDGLAQLPNSQRDIPEALATDVLQGAAATTDGFLKKAPAYAALHLSTHASAGGRTIPGIEFADRTLTLPEIYAQRFHASLVSLSACETASGAFAQSEGVLSLARAFAYAGAQSLVASHWAVNDRSTADLFSAFYDHLSKGMTKAEALRQAKLQYLSSSEMDVRKAPFHWAAFTLTGMDGKVELGGGRNWIWWVVLAVGLVGGGFFWWKRQRAASQMS